MQAENTPAAFAIPPKKKQAVPEWLRAELAKRQLQRAEEEAAAKAREESDDEEDATTGAKDGKDGTSRYHASASFLAEILLRPP